MAIQVISKSRQAKLNNELWSINGKCIRCVNHDSGYKMIASRRILESKEVIRCQCSKCGKRGTYPLRMARGKHIGYVCSNCLKDLYGWKVAVTNHTEHLFRMPEVVVLPLETVVKGGRL